MNRVKLFPLLSGLRGKIQGQVAKIAWFKQPPIFSNRVYLACNKPLNCVEFATGDWTKYRVLIAPLENHSLIWLRHATLKIFFS